MQRNPTKGVVSSNNTTSKNYSYSKNNVNLNFTLRTDVKKEQKDFLELMKRAVRELESDLEASKAE